jgi:putative DNA primase/helicase
VRKQDADAVIDELRAKVPSGGREDNVALTFADQHAGEFAYIAASNRWMRWAGPRWQVENTLAAFDSARTLCRAAGDSRHKVVAAVVGLARTDRRIAATADQWDRNPDILATPAGTIDLRTGLQRAPDRTDYITKCTGCHMAPEHTPHPLWSKFLKRITENGKTEDDIQNGIKLRQFLQRYLGYALTGHVIEHAFVFGHGTGANGKGTFITTLAKILGDYACVADTGTFLDTNNERHPTDIAKLFGIRLAIAQETQKGRRWDEAKLKALTGGDKLTGRFMRQDFFDFMPTHKLFIVGNHKPTLTTNDEAMRRRLLLVPFTVQIPEKERDTDLPHKLEAELPAILRWCVEGAVEWYRSGLNPPSSVREATKAYFADHDVLGQWLAEEVKQDAGLFAFTLTADLFTAWRDWCEKRNLRPGSTQSFSESLSGKGFAKGRDGTGRMGFKGIELGFGKSE